MGIEIEIIAIDDERRREKTVLFSSQRAGGERDFKIEINKWDLVSGDFGPYSLGRVLFWA